MGTRTKRRPTMARDNKIGTNVRLTPTARRLMVDIADAWGIAQGDVIEMLVRATVNAVVTTGFRLPRNVPVSTEAKEQTNIRLTQYAKDSMSHLAHTWGLPHGTVVEILLRLEAARIELASGRPTEVPWRRPRNGPRGP